VESRNSEIKGSSHQSAAQAVLVFGDLLATHAGCYRERRAGERDGV